MQRKPLVVSRERNLLWEAMFLAKPVWSYILMRFQLTGTTKQPNIITPPCLSSDKRFKTIPITLQKNPQKRNIYGLVSRLVTIILAAKDVECLALRGTNLIPMNC